MQFVCIVSAILFPLESWKVSQYISAWYVVKILVSNIDVLTYRQQSRSGWIERCRKQINSKGKKKQWIPKTQSVKLKMKRYKDFTSIHHPELRVSTQHPKSFPYLTVTQILTLLLTRQVVFLLNHPGSPLSIPFLIQDRISFSTCELFELHPPFYLSKQL